MSKCWIIWHYFLLIVHFRTPPDEYSYRDYTLLIMQSKTFMYLTARAEENDLALHCTRRTIEETYLQKKIQVSQNQPRKGGPIIIA